MFDVQLSLLVIGLSLEFRGGPGVLFILYWKHWCWSLDPLRLICSHPFLLIQEGFSGHIRGTVATSKNIQ